MVEHTRQTQSKDPIARFDEAIDDPVPLFLADQYDARYQQDELAFAAGRKRNARTSRIVTGLLALSAVTAGLALLSTDATRAIIVNAKASLASAVPAPSGAPQTTNGESGVTPDAATRPIQPVALASASPSREEIAAAYQSAMKTRIIAAEPVTRETAQPARRIDPDEVAALLARAKSLLAIGDINSARLLLERAADAQEADAALMLAGTYDPQVLGSQDMRSITPDPAMARLWYRKAAQLGSTDARRRLAEVQN
jgi:hypothetical protein